MSSGVTKYKCNQMKIESVQQMMYSEFKENLQPNEQIYSL
jgi:hypothetical protein